MLFSILIPTYNNGKTIHKAIDSALKQDYKGEYEIVVVNNASKDNTSEVLSRYNSPRLHVYTNKVTVNVYANHNVALGYAKGDYVIYCHGDDELLPNALSIYNEHLMHYNYPSKYIALGHSMFRDFSAWINGYDHLLSYNMLFSGWTAKRIFASGGTTPSGTCYSRERFMEIGGFDETDGAYESDWLAFLKAAFDGFEFEFIDRMVFKREYASTYVASNQNKIIYQRKLSEQRFISSLTSLQKEELEDMYWTYSLEMWDPIFAKPIPPREERLDALMQRYKKAPWKVWKLLKWVLIKWNFWR